RRLGDVGVDVDDEILLGLRVTVFRRVGEDVAGVGMDRNFRQLGDARAALAVAESVAVAGFGHGALPRARPASGGGRGPLAEDIRRYRGDLPVGGREKMGSATVPRVGTRPASATANRRMRYLLPRYFLCALIQSVAISFCACSREIRPAHTIFCSSFSRSSLTCAFQVVP